MVVESTLLQATQSTAFITNKRFRDAAIQEFLRTGFTKLAPDSPVLQPILDYLFQKGIEFLMHWDAVGRQFVFTISPASKQVHRAFWENLSDTPEPTLLTAKVGGFTLTLIKRLIPEPHWELSSVGAASKVKLASDDLEEAQEEALRGLSGRLRTYIDLLDEITR